MVQRCNHCTNAPCVTICPVNALQKRKDGIVDLDRDACIGCRACMQACPYDAIYLNDDLGAAEKCHFCAHRVEKNLEPACVVVCPVNAIIPGDFEDPNSRVSQLTKEKQTKVRRPEQGTGPNVRYIGVSDAALHPGRPARPETYLWSDRPPHKREQWPVSLPVLNDALVVLDADRRVEWGWGVALYLVTKGIGAGAAMLSPFAGMLGLRGGSFSYGPEIVALLFTLITCGLLVEDLKKPWAFYRMLTRPNFKSWLVKGGIILTLFQMTLVATLALQYFGVTSAIMPLRVVNAIIGLGVAGYTAFLFAQCNGRDLWESKEWLLPHLLIQATMCGAITFLVFNPHSWPLRIIAIVTALLHVAFALREKNGEHHTENARQGAAFLSYIRCGPLNCWRDGLFVGIAIAILYILFVPLIAWIPLLGALFLYEYAFVRAGQLPPLS